MQSAFINAARPAAHLCLGFRLAPLQLGHVRLLYKEGSPFVCGGPVTMQSLVHAVFICCQDWKESERGLARWWLRPFVWLWGLRCCRSNLQEEAEKFVAYWEEELQRPETKSAVQPSGESTAPFWMHFVVSALMDLGLTMAEAMDMRLSELGCYLTLAAMREGRTELWTDADEALWQAAHIDDGFHAGAKVSRN